MLNWLTIVGIRNQSGARVKYFYFIVALYCSAANAVQLDIEDKYLTCDRWYSAAFRTREYVEQGGSLESLRKYVDLTKIESAETETWVKTMIDRAYSSPKETYSNDTEFNIIARSISHGSLFKRLCMETPLAFGVKPKS